MFFLSLSLSSSFTSPDRLYEFLSHYFRTPCARDTHRYVNLHLNFISYLYFSYLLFLTMIFRVTSILLLYVPKRSRPPKRPCLVQLHFLPYLIHFLHRRLCHLHLGRIDDPRAPTASTSKLKDIAPTYQTAQSTRIDRRYRVRSSRVPTIAPDDRDRKGTRRTRANFRTRPQRARASASPRQLCTRGTATYPPIRQRTSSSDPVGCRP